MLICNRCTEAELSWFEGPQWISDENWGEVRWECKEHPPSPFVEQGVQLQAADTSAGSCPTISKQKSEQDDQAGSCG